MIEPVKVLNRYVMKQWAKSGKAIGYIFNILDNHESAYNNKTLLAQLKGSLQIPCNLNDHVQSRIYFFGAYEPIEVYLLNSLLRENSVVLDVGANIGFYSLFLSNKITTGAIHAFEPVPGNLTILQSNVIRNRRSDVITVHPVGLWKEETTLTFSLPADKANNKGSFTAGATDGGMAAVECKVTTLDQFVKTHGIQKIDFIKMDIEGSELFALKGGEATIAALRPNFLLEINPLACEGFHYTVNDIEVFLKKFDYTFYKIGSTPEDSGFITTLAGASQMNIFALNAATAPQLNTHWNPKQIFKYFLDV